MNSILEKKLIKIARSKITSTDPSHDINHTLRVLKNAKNIANSESADINIITASALFHDLITYAKNDPRSKNEQAERAKSAEEVLKNIKEFPYKKYH